MLLEVTGLRRSYGRVAANDGIDLEVDGGEVFGLLGHNGAGKTTLVNQVVGLLKPDAGTIRIDGRDVVAHPALARRLCSVQPQAQVPITGLTPRQAIDLLGRLRGGERGVVRDRTAQLADALEIGEWLDVDAGRLSGGVKRLVSFAMAAIVPGRVVIFDEPTNDVDPVRRRLLWREIRRLADAGTAVLLVTHNVVEAERAVDRLAILDHGKVIASGTPADLKAHVADELRIELVMNPAGPILVAPPIVRIAAKEGNRISARVGATFAGEAAAWARDLVRGDVAEEFSLAPATLEDVYVALVEPAGSEANHSTGSAPAETPHEEETDVRAA